MLHGRLVDDIGRDGQNGACGRDGLHSGFGFFQRSGVPPRDDDGAGSSESKRRGYGLVVWLASTFSFFSSSF